MARPQCDTPLVNSFRATFSTSKEKYKLWELCIQELCVHACACVHVFLQDKELRYRFVYNAFPTLTEEVQY
jgi:hypothetical protein